MNNIWNIIYSVTIIVRLKNCYIIYIKIYWYDNICSFNIKLHTQTNKNINYTMIKYQNIIKAKIIIFSCT